LKNNPNQQLYDGTLKGLFGEQAAWIIPYLLPMARLEATPLGAEEETKAELNIEINRTTLKADLLYKALYRQRHIILVIELQTKHDPDLQRRLMAYHGSLHLEHNKPILILVIYVFEEGPEDLSYQDGCENEVFATIHPKVIRLRDLDSEQIVKEHQLSLYTLLPATKRPEVHLLKQALKEMHEHDGKQEFTHHITWFNCIMNRTQTMSDEEKQTIREVLQVQYQIDPLIREDPTIMAIVAETEAKTLRDAILDLISDRFPSLVVSQVQHTIAPTQDTELLKKLHRQLARVSDEREVPALLAQCFPPNGETKSRIECECIQDSILDIASARFSSQIATQVQHTIAPVQNAQQLRKFLRQLALVSDEQEVYALLAQCFPTH